jgi:hypothetical protein
MNTPRSKPPPRYTFEARNPTTPDGTYRDGIHNDEVAAALGRIACTWPHVEEHMISVFEYLTKLPNRTTARQIFRSIINQRTRIDIMKTMLEKSPENTNAEPFFDDAIAEFSRLNTMRNTYVHGLWWTFQDGKVFFVEVSDDPHYRTFDEREVDATELKGIAMRMHALMIKLVMRDLFD